MKFSFLTFTLSCITPLLLYSMTPDEQLIEATQTNNIRQAQKALTAGANVNAQNSNGCTPLIQTIASSEDMGKYTIENSTMVKLLLSAGANINVQDHNNCTPLHYALSNRCTYIAKLLIVNFTM